MFRRTCLSVRDTSGTIPAICRSFSTWWTRFRVSTRRPMVGFSWPECQEALEWRATLRRPALTWSAPSERWPGYGLPGHDHSPSPSRSLPSTAPQTESTPMEEAGRRARDESVPEAARRWVLANGLEDTPTETSVSATLTRTSYGADDHPGQVNLWTSLNAGHTWPGSRPRLTLRLLLGRTSHEIDATAEIWSFATRFAAPPHCA